MTIDDDTLSAYLDGELPADEMARVARAVEGDAEARARLAAFRRVQALVGEANRLEKAPVHLAAAIRAAPIGRRVTARTWLEGMRFAFDGLFVPPRPALSAFAVLVLVVGIAAFGAGSLVTSGPRSVLAAANDATPGSALHTALERVASGGGADTADGHVTLIATFRDRNGRHCREYDYGAAAPGTASVTGIACRVRGDGWRVEVAVLTENPTVETGYVPASEAAHRAVEAFVRERAQGAPLNAADEAKAIASGWE